MFRICRSNEPKLWQFIPAKSLSTLSGGSATVIPFVLQFFNELRTSLRTEKYNKINNDGSQPDIAKILSERMRENNERKKRLRARLEQMLLEADCYVLGRLQQLKSTGVAARVDEACAYLLENTYTKLDYLQNYQENPLLLF